MGTLIRHRAASHLWHCRRMRRFEASASTYVVLILRDANVERPLAEPLRQRNPHQHVGYGIVRPIQVSRARVWVHSL